jgi:hypothetical protein
MGTLGSGEISWRRAITIVLAVAVGALLLPVAVQAAASYVVIQDATTQNRATVGANGALTVEDVNAPTDEPFQIDGSCSINGFLGCGKTLYTVPSGKLLVIQEVTLHVTVPKGQKVPDASIATSLGGFGITHQLSGQNEGTSQNGSTDHFAYTHHVTLYADGLVSFNVVRNSYSGTITASGTISGYLVDA